MGNKQIIIIIQRSDLYLLIDNQNKMFIQIKFRRYISIILNHRRYSVKRSSFCRCKTVSEIKRRIEYHHTHKFGKFVLSICGKSLYTFYSEQLTAFVTCFLAVFCHIGMIFMTLSTISIFLPLLTIRSFLLVNTGYKKQWVQNVITNNKLNQVRYNL